MSDYIILTNQIIIIVSLIAIILALTARFTTNKYICAGLYVISFLCVVGCTIYALLLGADLKELLAYILIFTLLGLTAFIPMPNEKIGNFENIEEKKDCNCDTELNHTTDDEEQATEEKIDEL